MPIFNISQSFSLIAIYYSLNSKIQYLFSFWVSQNIIPHFFVICLRKSCTIIYLLLELCFFLCLFNQNPKLAISHHESVGRSCSVSLQDCRGLQNMALSEYEGFFFMPKRELSDAYQLRKNKTEVCFPAPISIRAGPIDIPIIKFPVNWWTYS